ncbi:centriolar coiled-coil protein of 110 kDa-like isoform X2 [Polypterus senegalus]|uniref:centriolar coiled-coil protein of 110 kDa-like isoform X2 n=1 Tax=Polypterus senegalus TaxID=55291 RepID=UPI0019652D9D|nr:centriolar coiled-coil protein of 110 kDa-like isoform X2 [Polypterus senegalus]
MKMEDYEEFCMKHLSHFQGEGRPHSPDAYQQARLSLIQFHGMAVLAPVLTSDQRQEMTQYRQRAVELEMERQGVRRSTLLTRVQKILDSVQVRKGPKSGKQDSTPVSCSSKCETKNGFTLLPDMNGLPISKVASGSSRTSNVEHTAEQQLHSAATYAEKKYPLTETSCQRLEQTEDVKNTGVSLHSLLRKSREYVELEQGRWESRAVQKSIHGESLSDKENENSSATEDPHEKNLFFIRNMNHGYVPAGQDSRTSSFPGMSAIHNRRGSDSDSSELISILPRSLTGSYARLPSPEPSLSPRMHRRRPRPLSAGNIVLTHPLSCTELSPAPDRMLKIQQGESPVPSQSRPTVPTPVREAELTVAQSTSEAIKLKAATTSNKRHSSLGIGMWEDEASSFANFQETAGFRQRSHTMDNHGSLGSLKNGKQSSGIYGSLPRRSQPRHSPVLLNKSYDVENPSPILLRAQQGCPGMKEDLDATKRQLDLDSQGMVDCEDQTTQGNKGEAFESEVIIKRQILALASARRRMEEEHAMQLSLLFAEQQREKERLVQEMVEQERHLKNDKSDLSVSSEKHDELPADWRAISESCPSRMTLLQEEILSACSSAGSGYVAQLCPGYSYPATQSPALLYGPHRGSKSYHHISQAMSPELHHRFCKLTALVKGFLTRRLLETEKVKHLRKTIKDTLEFIGTFLNEAPQKRGAISAQDLSLQERVLAQLRAALFDIHDIFFLLPLHERLGLLQQDRQLRQERRLRELEKSKNARDRVTLSAATQKFLDRKKQISTEMPAPAKKAQPKVKSPPTNRILQPNQGQNAPQQGQLCRQGSLCRKTPEERVKRSEGIRKQHSLG